LGTAQEWARSVGNDAAFVECAWTIHSVLFLKRFTPVPDRAVNSRYGRELARSVLWQKAKPSHVQSKPSPRPHYSVSRSMTQVRKLRITFFLSLLLLAPCLPVHSQGPDVDGLLNLANRYYGAGDADAGLKTANQALTLARAGASSVRQLAWALHTVGLGYQLKRDFTQARNFHIQAITVLDEAQGGRKDSAPKLIALLLSNIFNNFAKLNAQERRFVEAEGMARRALELRSRHLESSDRGFIPVLTTIIDVLSDTGREAESLPYQSRLLSIYDASGEARSPQALQVVIRLAHLWEDMGNYPEAERLYTRALEARQRFLPPGHPNIASSMADLAAFLANQNRLDDAERLFNQSLSILERRSGPDSLDVAKLYNDMAAVYGLRNADMAESYLRRALAIYKSKDNEGGRKNIVMTNLADFLRVRGRYEEAESLFAEADVAYQNLGDGRLKGLFFIARGHLHLALQRLDAADADFKRGRRILRDVLGSTSGAEIMSANGSVSTQIRRQDWIAAGAELADVTNIIAQGLRRGGDSMGRPIVGGTSLAARVAAQHVGELNQVLYRQGLSQPNGSRENAAPSFIATQWSIRPAAAAALSSMAVRTVVGSQKLRDLIRDRQDLVLRWRQNDSRRTILFTTGSRIELDERQQVQNELEEMDAHIRTIDIELQREFPSYASYANPEPLSIPETQQLLRADEVLVSFLSTDVTEELPGETFIWAVTKSEFRWVRSELGTPSLTRLVGALRCGLDEEEWRTATKASRCGDLLGLAELPDKSRPLPFDLGKAHELYQALFGQIEDLIKGKRLIIVPPGPLTSLPFQVLVTEQPETALPSTFEGYRNIAWLGRSHALSVLPAVSSLKALRVDTIKGAKAPDDYVGYGNPVLKGDGGSCRSSKIADKCPTIGPADRRQVVAANDAGRATIAGQGNRRIGTLDQIFHNGASAEAVIAQVRSLCPLPDTAYEIRCVGEHFRPDSRLIRLDKDATKADIQALSADGTLAHYRIVHFATHGSLRANDRETSES
jgi:tetratricopeptide (TPR) repeat protein